MHISRLLYLRGAEEDLGLKKQLQNSRYNGLKIIRSQNLKAEARSKNCEEIAKYDTSSLSATPCFLPSYDGQSITLRSNSIRQRLYVPREIRLYH